MALVSISHLQLGAPGELNGSVLRRV